MKVLIIQAKMGIGDMIIYLPYIHAISKKYKRSVSVLVKDSSRAKELLAEDNHINEIINLEKNMDGMKGIFKLSKELKKRNFDKIFIFNSSLRYNLIARLSNIKSIYQYPLFRSKDNIVISAKVFTEEIVDNIVSSEPNLIIKNESFNVDENFKHICLGISASGPTKRWDIENFIKLAKKINDKIKRKFYLAGGTNDINLINKFKNSFPQENFISFEKLRIKETLPIISKMDLMISNDTSWSHLAVALKIKTLTLFMDSPVMAYGRYSSRMFTIEPAGQKNTTTHNTLGKDKISFDEVLNKSIEYLI